jgi:hypothetical protein
MALRAGGAAAAQRSPWLRKAAKCALGVAAASCCMPNACDPIPHRISRAPSMRKDPKDACHIACSWHGRGARPTQHAPGVQGRSGSSAWQGPGSSVSMSSMLISWTGRKREKGICSKARRIAG